MKTRQQNLHLPRDFVLAKFKRDARERASVVRRLTKPQAAEEVGTGRFVARPGRPSVCLPAAVRACLLPSCAQECRVSHTRGSGGVVFTQLDSRHNRSSMFRPPLKGTTPGDTNVSIQVPEMFIYLFIYLSPSLFGSVRFDLGYLRQFCAVENLAIFLIL
jgi:hypothetical protein